MYKDFKEVRDQYVEDTKHSDQGIERLIDIYLTTLQLKLPTELDLLPEWYDLLAIKAAIDLLYSQVDSESKARIKLANSDFNAQILKADKNFKNKLSELSDKNFNART